MGGDWIEIVPKPNHVVERDGSPENEGPRRVRGANGAALESVAKRSRRVFSASEKMRIVKEADACLASGERGALGALLRREGIYSSLLSTWRTQLGLHGTEGMAKDAGADDGPPLLPAPA